MLFVDAAHESCGRREDLIDEDEDGLLGRQLDALADDVDELADSQVGRDEVLLLVDGGNVGLLDLLADNLVKAVSVACKRRDICNASKEERQLDNSLSIRAERELLTGMRSAYF